MVIHAFTPALNFYFQFIKSRDKKAENLDVVLRGLGDWRPPMALNPIQTFLNALEEVKEFEARLAEAVRHLNLLIVNILHFAMID